MSPIVRILALLALAAAGGPLAEQRNDRFGAIARQARIPVQ